MDNEAALSCRACRDIFPCSFRYFVLSLLSVSLPCSPCNPWSRKIVSRCDSVGLRASASSVAYYSVKPLSFCSQKRDSRDTPSFQNFQNCTSNLHKYARRNRKTAYLCRKPYIYAERGGQFARRRSIPLASRIYLEREPHSYRSRTITMRLVFGLYPAEIRAEFGENSA